MVKLVLHTLCLANAVVKLVLHTLCLVNAVVKLVLHKLHRSSQCCGKLVPLIAPVDNI